MRVIWRRRLNLTDKARYQIVHRSRNGSPSLNENFLQMAQASLGVLPDSARNLVWSDLGSDALESLIQSVLLFRGENLFGQR